jgi:hypothetical protein
MRQSRLAQFNELKAQLEEKGQAFVDECFPDVRPTVFYTIRMDCINHPKEKYTIAECPVTGVRYHWQLPYNDGKHRPSVKDVEKARLLLDAPMDDSHVLLHTEWKWGDGYKYTSTGAEPLADFYKHRPGYAYVSFDRATLEPILADLIATYVPKEGQFCCHYCGKATDNAKKIHGTVIAAQYPNMRGHFDYCSAQCNGHDQMAHEG